MTLQHPQHARPHTAEQLTGQDTSHLVVINPTNNQMVHADMAPAMLALQAAAREAGFDMRLASAFRPFDRQLWIWNNKFTGQRPILDSHSQPLDPDTLTDVEKIHAILRWSALPGGSRHHWGTDVDVYAANCLPEGTSLQLEPWEYEAGGHQHAFAQWLHRTMPEFGFYLPYAQERQGVACEPWHISYYPISQHLLQQLTPDMLKRTLQATDIAGKSQILANLDTLYTRYIANIGEV
ncbi:D,D-carboxypeptidase family protein [Photobacterium aphoticum]|uniref:D,D-carboxypeptidase family protein n=1 Tax=Photobacterium aphoticum TaxID=754436 RepID=A0A090QX15_9GAMM|nr:D,D-carboxypeptidase family protein [Photobacterium aphoticum]